MARRKIIDIINSCSEDSDISDKFVLDVKSAISRYDKRNARKGSNYYKPSSMNCLRLMYFIRTEAQEDDGFKDSELIGMADTGTKRHESIQTVLSNMKEMGYDWEYVDVAEYIKQKQAQKKCEGLVVSGKSGNETHLVDNNLKVSFLCDGILRYVPDDTYYLFEMKNVVSFKFNKVTQEPLEQHKRQVECYCALLDLDNVLMLYENRDICQLKCVSYTVSQEMKESIISRLVECEEYVKASIIPPKDSEDCQYCSFKSACSKVS